MKLRFAFIVLGAQCEGGAHCVVSSVQEVLAAHSGVVAAMLSTQHEIEIPGVAYSFVQRVMRGIYRGDLLWIWVRPACCLRVIW